MKPTNTQREANIDPLATLFGTLSPGGIECQESRGQAELVKSESLPTECHDRTALEAAGVVFGAPYPDDPLFCPVTLPKGWKKAATDHSMHSHLLDDKGRVRAGIFYKAAFYDRRANLSVRRRFSRSSYEDGADDQHQRVVIKDGDKVIHVAGEYRRNDWDTCKLLEKDADDWLNQQFPDWQNAAAYWDAP